MLAVKTRAFKRANWLYLSLAGLLAYAGMAGSWMLPTVAEAAATAVRIDAGSPTSYRDSKGRPWSADTAFVGGYTVARGPISIAGTADSGLYQTERWGLAGYKVPVPNGTYSVTLHFAETYAGVTGPGQRVFGVSVQGTSLGNLDVYALAGGRNQALIKSVNVMVANNELDVLFTNVSGNAMINALEILPMANLTPTQVPPTATTVPATPTQAPPAATSAYKQAVLADRPTAFWRLDESSGTSAADASGQGHTATSAGGVTLGSAGALASDADTAMTFDGQSGNVRDNSSVTVGGDFTIEAWVKANSSTQNAPLVSLYGGQSTRTLYLQGQQFRGMTDMSSNWASYAITSSSVDTTNWHHVVFTSQGGTSLSLFVDGLASGTATVPATSAFSANTVLGWSDATWLTKFGGGLDEVALYPTALPADRIKAHYSAGGSVSPPTCPTSLQSLVDAAPAGSVLKLPACVYRETVTVNKSLTIDGQNAAEIRGSDVFSSWTPSGAQWTSTGTVPNFGTDPWGNTWLGQHVEQVFIDGSELTQVAASPNSSQFVLDGSRHVGLAFNPTGHTIEVSTRQFWLQTTANNVTITRMTMKHSAQVAQGHPIGNDGYSGWVLSYSNLSHVHGTVVGLGDPNYYGGGTVGPRISHSDISYGGNQGYGAWASHGAVIEYSTIHHNGWGGYDMAWQGGGGKLAGSNNTEVAYNEFYNNRGPGPWWDILCNGALIHHNRVHDNTGVSGIGQIMYEESSNASIHDNQIWGSSVNGIGIYASSSGGVEIFNNTVYHHLAGDTIFVVYNSARENFAGRGQNQYVHDNLLMHDVDGGPVDNRGLVWWSDDNTTLYNPANNNHASNNQFWYPNAEIGNIRFFSNGQISSIATFAAMLGGTSSAYMTNAEKDAALVPVLANR
jgi:hypothetical protein